MAADLTSSNPLMKPQYAKLVHHMTSKAVQLAKAKKAKKVSMKAKVSVKVK